MVVRCEVCGRGFNFKSKRDEHQEMCKVAERIEGRWIVESFTNLSNDYYFVGLKEQMYEKDGLHCLPAIKIAGDGKTAVTRVVLELVKQELEKDNCEITILDENIPKMFYELVYQEVVVEKPVEKEVVRYIPIALSTKELYKKYREQFTKELYEIHGMQRFYRQ